VVVPLTRKYCNFAYLQQTDKLSHQSRWQEGDENVRDQRARADYYERAYQAEKEKNCRRSRDDASRSRSLDRVPDHDSHLGSVDGTGFGGLNGLD
jgi:hypothetical protein